MTRKMELGAPSLTGKDTNELAAREFDGAVFPLAVTITNHMPRDIALPEVDGLFLRHCAGREGVCKSVVLKSAEQLQRLASSVGQIAELNGYARALTIETAGEIKKPVASATPAVSEPPESPPPIPAPKKPRSGAAKASAE